MTTMTSSAARAARWASLLTCIALLWGCPQEEAEPAADLTGCQVLAQLQGRAGSQIRSTLPGAGALADYNIGDDTVAPKVPNPCANAIAARMQTSACSFCNRDGGACEGLIQSIFADPPLVCSPCGDGQCSGEEDALSCPNDCAASCGDGMCEADETDATCPLDCQTTCGDSVCRGGETPADCPQDCNFAAGDGLCSQGENPANSPADCAGQTIGQPCEEDGDCGGAVCDGETRRCVCRSAGGEGGVCATTTCGDGYCQSYENSLACPGDCCGPLACEADGALGCMGNVQVRCNLVGLGNCPEVEALATCDNGCVQGQCRTCPDSLPGVTFCDGPSQVCAGRDVLTLCEPLPGYPGCFMETSVNCRDALGEAATGFMDPTCTPTGCGLGCPEPCPLNALRCAEDGAAQERCVNGANGSPCVGWVREPCGDGAACDPNFSQCVPTGPRVASVTPQPATVGGAITIAGAGFGEAPGEVTVPPALAATVTSWTDTEIVATVPEGAQSGTLTVVTADDARFDHPSFAVTP